MEALSTFTFLGCFPGNQTPSDSQMLALTDVTQQRVKVVQSQLTAAKVWNTVTQ